MRRLSGAVGCLPSRPCSTCFIDFRVPGPSPMSVPAHVMTLQPWCEAVDSGAIVPNINDGFSGSAGFNVERSSAGQLFAFLTSVAPDTKTYSDASAAKGTLAARGYITNKDRKALIVAAEDEPLPAAVSRN